jgi:predicted HTH domain antitoxin
VSIERRRKNVEVTISKELIPYLYTIQTVETVQDKVTLSVAIELFVSGTITLEKAAELAEKSIWDFGRKVS